MARERRVDLRNRPSTLPVREAHAVSCGARPGPSPALPFRGVRVNLIWISSGTRAVVPTAGLVLDGQRDSNTGGFGISTRALKRTPGQNTAGIPSAYVNSAMSADSQKCSVCGGEMRRVKVLPSNAAKLVRYKCTCGHCEDLKDDRSGREEPGHGMLVLDGFEETL